MADDPTAPGAEAAAGGAAPAPSPVAGPPAPAVPAGGPAGDPAEAADAVLSPAGDRLVGALGRLVERAIDWAAADAAAIRATWRRLGGLADLDLAAARAVAADLAPALIAALAVALAGRIALGPLARRLDRGGAEAGMIARAGRLLLIAALQVAVVILALAAAVAIRGESAEDPLFLHFIATFLVVGMLLIALGAILAPGAPALRFLPMGDAAARYWFRRIGLVAAALAVGEILLPAALAGLVTPIAARSATVAVYLAALLYAIWLAVSNRKGPARHFRRVADARPDELWPAFVAHVARWWHIPVALGLAALLHRVLTTGAEAVPALLDALWVALAFGVAALGVAGLDRAAERGVRLPGRARRLMPEVETRANAFFRPFLRALRWPLAAAWLLFALQALGVAPVWAWLQSRFGIDILATMSSLVLVALGAFAVWLAVEAWAETRLAPRGGRPPTARERTLVGLLRNAAVVAILLVALYYALLEIGVSLAPLLASAGVIALAISWGSQKLVQDVINGFFIQLENAVNVGDIVEVAGRTGLVEKLTIRSVSLRDVEGVYHVIPFSAIDAVSNHMKGFSYHVADVSVAYGADVDVAKAAMLAAYDDLASSPDWSDGRVSGFEWFGVEQLADSGVQLRARLKTSPGEQWAAGRAYAELVKKRFDAAGVEIPFPQMKLWFGTGDGPGRSAALRPTRQTLDADGPPDADQG